MSAQVEEHQIKGQQLYDDDDEATVMLIIFSQRWRDDPRSVYDKEFKIWFKTMLMFCFQGPFHFKLLHLTDIKRSSLLSVQGCQDIQHKCSCHSPRRFQTWVLYCEHNLREPWCHWEILNHQVVVNLVWNNQSIHWSTIMLQLYLSRSCANQQSSILIYLEYKSLLHLHDHSDSPVSCLVVTFWYQQVCHLHEQPLTDTVVWIILTWH